MVSGGADTVRQGGPGYTLYTAYSGAVLVAGGSGISYVMSVLDDMLQKHASGKSHVRVIEVIWSVMDPGEEANQEFLVAVLPELTVTAHQIRFTLCFPSLPRSCNRALHRITRSPSASAFIGLEPPLTHRACRARRFRRECISAQDAPTFLPRCKT